MPTGANVHERGLTGFRALAVTWVLLFHLNGMVGPKVIATRLFGFEIEWHPLLTIGWVGANLFFVLSGFLLTNRLIERLAVEERAPALKSYFIARVRRVFPAYWAQIAILLAVSLLVSHQAPDWVRFLPLHAVMAHNLSYEASWAINPVYWTLPIEFSFYLCLPLIALVLLRAERTAPERKWATLVLITAGIVALSWTYRYLVYQPFAAAEVNARVWVLNQIPGTIDQFMLGGTASVAMRWTRAAWANLPERSRTVLSTVLLFAGLGGLVGLMYFIDSIFEVFWNGHWAVFVWYTFAAAFISVALCGIVIGSPAARALFANPVSVFIGTISYSIYLWHYPIAAWVAHSVDISGMPIAYFLGIAVPPILVASALSYWFIERPFMAKSTREREAGAVDKSKGPR